MHIKLSTWYEVAFSVGVIFLVTCALLFVNTVIQHYRAPYPHVTCSVVLTLSDHMSHVTEWEIREGDKCGEIHL